MLWRVPGLADMSPLFGKEGPGGISERPELPANLQILEPESLDESAIAAILAKAGESLGGFLHLHPPTTLESSVLNLDAGANALVRHVFLLAKHLQSKLTAPTDSGRRHFTCVVWQDGRLGTTGNGVNAVAGGLSGLAKTLQIEWPTVFCRTVDLAPELTADEAAQRLAAELTDPDGRTQEIGLSPQGRVAFLPRVVKRLSGEPDFVRPELVEACPEQSRRGNEIGLRQAQPERETEDLTAPVFLPEALQTPSTEDIALLPEKPVWLVSGGARGVTADCVLELARRQPGTFLLAGRSSLEDEPEWAAGIPEEVALRQAAMQALQAAGEKPTPVKVRQLVGRIDANRAIRATLQQLQDSGSTGVYVSADATDATKLREAIAPHVQQHGVITGVIHGAGVLADKLIEKKTPEDFDAVVGTKVHGLQALLDAVDPEQLSHLLLFSSAAGFYGNGGQSDYAIGNEILNRAAFAFQQAHPNCRVVSYNWGPWEGGMVTPELKRMFEERGVEVIPVADGARIFADFAGMPEARGHGPLGLREHDPLLLIGNSLAAQYEPPPEVKRSRKLERKLSAAQNPALADHMIGEHAVVPAVCALGWMADAVEQLAPGYRLAACEDFQVLKGIVFDNSLAERYQLDLEEVEREPGLRSVVDAKITSPGGKLPRPHYRVRLHLAKVTPDSPIGDPESEIRNPKSEIRNFYEDGTLFHGPKFQGILRVAELTEQRLLAECRMPTWSDVECGQFRTRPFNPYTLDPAFQAMLVWARAIHNAGSLPLKLARLEHFQAIPFDTPYTLDLRVKSHSPTALVADLDLVLDDGQVAARMLGAEVTLSENLNALFLKSAA